VKGTVSSEKKLILLQQKKLSKYVPPKLGTDMHNVFNTGSTVWLGSDKDLLAKPLAGPGLEDCERGRSNYKTQHDACLVRYQHQQQIFAAADRMPASRTRSRDDVRVQSASKRY
jgi:hypothetical protein